MLHSTLLVLPLLFTLTHAFPHTLSSQLPTTPETTAVHQAFYESDSLGESEDVGEDAPAREWGGLGAGVKGLFSFGRRSVPVEALWERAVETIIENPKWEAILSESSASVASVVAESVASVASAESVVVVEAQVTTSVTSQATSSAGSSTEPSTSAFEVPSTTAPSPTTSSTTKSSTTKSSTTKLATTTSKKTSTSTTSSSSAAAAAFSAVGETSSGLVLAGVHTGQATYFDVGLGACGNTATNSDYIGDCRILSPLRDLPRLQPRQLERQPHLWQATHRLVWRSECHSHGSRRVHGVRDRLVSRLQSCGVRVTGTSKCRKALWNDLGIPRLRSGALLGREVVFIGRFCGG